MEIVPGIHLTPAGAEARVSVGVGPPNAYLLAGTAGAAFIDTGYDIDRETRSRLDYVAALDGVPVKAIIVTHRHADHMGGAAHIHKATGGEIFSNPVEQPSVDAALGEAAGPGVGEGDGRPRVHRTVEDGETLDLGGLTLEFVHAPGHTVGSLAIYAREPRVLFTGDNVLGNVTPSISPDHGDMALYFQTLHRFLDFDMALICPGHGPMVQDARQWVEKVIQHRLEREEQVLSALRRGHGTVEEMFREIYPVLDSRLHSRAQGQIRCHLIKLEREGRVRANDGSYALTQAG